MNNKIGILIVITILIFLSVILGIRYTYDVSALEKINITVEDIEIQELHLKHCKIKLKVDISNPTNEYISRFSAEFDISIAEIYVGNGSVPLVSIPAQIKIKRDVILTIYYTDVGNAVIEGIQTRNFDLSIHGQAKGNVLFNLIVVSKSFDSSYSYS
jgi:hypothetical protein